MRLFSLFTLHPSLFLSAGHVRIEGLHVTAGAAEEVDCVAPAPGIGGIADDALRVAWDLRPLAVITGQRLAGHFDLGLAADLLAVRTAPADGHRSSPRGHRKISHHESITLI